MNKKDYLVYLRNNSDISLGKLKKIKEIPLVTDGEISDFFHFCSKNNIKYMVGDEIFLKKVKPLPYIVFYKWNLNLLDKKIVGIVWPRKINSFIKFALEKFLDFLKDKDVVIVSGLADGTDSYAHTLALKNNIPTIAVLWFWILKGYNSQNRSLLEKIEKNGLILSEFRLNQEWTKRTFPQRNRIIAWLSDFLFVPQASEKSWTLITVNKAIEYWIEVYSLFSNYFDEFWKWTNKLISEWKIKWIYDFNLFLEEISQKFSLISKSFSDNFEFSEEEKMVVNSIKKWNNTLELLQMDLGIPIDKILNILSLLELKGVVFSELNEYFVK